MKRTKLLVTLHLQFELESDAGFDNERNAVNQLIEQLEKVPLIAMGATVDVVSVNNFDELN
jgi:hypothetical protein